MLYVGWRMLVGNHSKFLGIVVGLTFAGLIMTQQPGVFVGLMTRTFGFITDVALPDIWVMDPEVQFIDDNKPLPSPTLYEVASIEGVSWAKPLFKGFVTARLPGGGFQNCNLIGVDSTTFIGAPAVLLQGHINDLHQSDSIIVNQEGALDKLATPPRHPGDPKTPLQIGQRLELNDHRAIVVGIAKTSRTFQSQPIIFTTFERAIQFSPPQRQTLTFILVKAKEGENLQTLCDRIHRQTGLSAYTKEQFKDLTIKYYLKYTGIPINFGISVLLGFLVGAAIAGQTFYNFTLENMRYFGVLKAMGISNKVLLFMIVSQALFVAFLGYGLGLGVTCLCALLTQDSMLAFRFPYSLMLFSLGGIFVISAFSAILSLRQVFKLDPAIVFRN
ncbi:MAG: ABC transporter permease [Alphaproteobacteria bacterium 16-39-46]|nr:MAG: ABC transporter permease [Alphaproteobacteria bacterium 16-39-46]OZA43616.1 MAG: ABC transporter permease [Alphaproteobacteria bacterium 17-39-52]HQS83776.1 ABC transporter permease [Alphaproteobacteria bacterium]HQS93599.1 ABC transporter permease [Alphaproteobacteria bacterium]